MKLLAFDTATEACTVALWQDGAVLERFERQNQHSERLLAMVESLLAEASASLTQLDAIAFGRGPGSFTGLRIGTGVAQGLAFAANLPVVPVSSLAVLAQGVEADHVLAAHDARMEQVYWGAYQRNAQGRMEAVQAEAVVSPSKAPFPDNARWVGVGPGWDVYSQALTERLGPALMKHSAGVLPQARHLAVLAVADCIAGRTVAAEDAVPVYLRDEVAVKSASATGQRKGR
jgi:tRNA threonylcarbamoyladenosine biosynthesis protein TsaB